jgi:hypothetical protein
MIETVESIAAMYVERDIFMKLDMALEIVRSINKLGYSSVNIPYLKEEFIKNNYITYIKNTNGCNITNYDTWCNDFVKLTIFKEYMNMVDVKLERSILLSKYIGTNNTELFYKACTVDELNYLGY